jgi:hypothetical protein
MNARACALREFHVDPVNLPEIFILLLPHTEENVSDVIGLSVDEEVRIPGIFSSHRLIKALQKKVSSFLAGDPSGESEDDVIVLYSPVFSLFFSFSSIEEKFLRLHGKGADSGCHWSFKELVDQELLAVRGHDELDGKVFQELPEIAPLSVIDREIPEDVKDDPRLHFVCVL